MAGSSYEQVKGTISSLQELNLANQRYNGQLEGETTFENQPEMTVDAATAGHSWEQKLEPGGYVSRCTVCGKTATQAGESRCAGKKTSDSEHPEVAKARRRLESAKFDKDPDAIRGAKAEIERLTKIHGKTNDAASECEGCGKKIASGNFMCASCRNKAK